MAEISARVAWRLRKAIGGKPKKASSKDGNATFIRTDRNGTGWVRMPGADFDTPVNGSMLSVASPGETVRYHIENGRLSVTGNASAPAVGQTAVNRTVAPVADMASDAINEATKAHQAAESAENDAARAAQAATDAESSASSAMSAAGQAQQSAQQAVADAGTANAAAVAAQGSAAQAATEAGNASASAQVAATQAANAAGSATQAANDAASANRSANSALTQLSVVQDVAGTLSWISEHGTYTATTDTSVVEGRVYFELDDGEYVPVVEPSGNPSQQGWYVLDISDSQTDYIMAHLAVTSAGLWILPSGMGQAQTPQGAPGYKLLLASDGMTVYDASGAQVVKYGSSIELGGTRAFHLGTNDAYILFYDSNNDGTPDSIRIGGANVTLGSSKKLEDLLDELDGVRSDLDGLEIGGRNLYVTVDSVAGYINGSDGSISPAGSVTKERASDYIPVTPGESMVFQVWVTPATGSNHYLWMAYAFYDSNKAYLNARPSKTKGANTGTPQYDYYEFTVPANAAYIRVSARMYNDGLIKLERGNKPTDWTPAPEDVDEDIESAKATATRYITETADGIMVHPDGDTTTGWSIKSALELLKGGLSYFKVWLDNSVAKVRVGLETAGHTIFSPNGMEVFSDSTTSVAEFGDEARIGDETGRHVTVKSDGLTVSASDVQDMFNVGNVDTPVTDSDFLASASILRHEFEGDATGITSETVSGTIQLGTVQVPDQVTWFRVYLKAGGGSYDDADKTLTNSDISPKVRYSNSRDFSKTQAASGLDALSAGLMFRHYNDSMHTNVSTKSYPFTLRMSYDSSTKMLSASMTGLTNSAVSNFYDVCWVGSVQVLIEQYVPTITYYPSYMTFGSRDSGHDIGAFSAAFGEMNAAVGENSVAEGWMSHAIGDNSHAEGCKSTALGTNSHAEGYDTTATGDYVHAEGSGSNAVGDDSHAEGSDTTANGACSHAEGLMSIANGANAHAEGSETYANGRSSHAEGDGTNAGGEASHAQNVGTVAASYGQTAMGTYNEADSNDEYALIIGNGTNANNRSNAFAVDWDGNALIDGDVQDMSGALRYAPIAYGSLTGMASALTLSTSAQKLPLGGTFSGSGCSESSNGVMVEEAGTYMITGSAYLFGGYTANDIVHLLVHVGATEVADCLFRATTANPYQTISTAPVVVQLAANSVVTMHAYNQVAARGTINSKAGHGLTVLRIA